MGLLPQSNMTTTIACSCAHCITRHYCRWCCTVL